MSPFIPGDEGIEHWQFTQPDDCDHLGRANHDGHGCTVSSAVGAARVCPDCGRPQHYTGAEHGWAHDALVDTWHCADPRKAGA